MAVEMRTALPLLHPVKSVRIVNVATKPTFDATIVHAGRFDQSAQRTDNFDPVPVADGKSQIDNNHTNRPGSYRLLGN